MMKVCVVSKLTVDKWRVVLKGENPDYIHATSVHVSENLGVYTSSKWDSALCVCVCGCVSAGIQAAESIHHCSGADAVHHKRLLEDGLQSQVWCGCHAL